MFPPAWSPFLSIIEQKGQSLAPMMWIDNYRIAIHVGATYEDGPIVVVGDGIVEQSRVLGFGRSPHATLFGLAFDDAIRVRSHSEGDRSRLAMALWPGGAAAWLRHEREIDKSHITQLVVFPDGKNVLPALREGVFVVSGSGATRLLPQPADYTKHYEWLLKEYPNDPLTLTIDMEHGAVSPHGDLVLAGCQVSKTPGLRWRAQTDGQIGPLQVSAFCMV